MNDFFITRAQHRDQDNINSVFEFNFVTVMK